MKVLFQGLHKIPTTLSQVFDLSIFCRQVCALKHIDDCSACRLAILLILLSSQSCKTSRCAKQSGPMRQSRKSICMCRLLELEPPEMDALGRTVWSVPSADVSKAWRSPSSCRRTAAQCKSLGSANTLDTVSACDCMCGYSAISCLSS